MDFATEVKIEEKNSYKTLIYSIIDFIKKDVEHEGTNQVFSPTEILDKIYCLASDLPDIKEKIYG